MTISFKEFASAITSFYHEPNRERLLEHGSVLYHVTLTKNVPSIKKKGILHFQTSNWTKGGGERYGEGEIYAMDSIVDAIRWAGKMDWSFNKTMGSGKISIVELTDMDNWKLDDADPLSFRSGKWLKRVGVVKPENIRNAYPVTIKMIKDAV